MVSASLLWGKKCSWWNVDSKRCFFLSIYFQAQNSFSEGLHKKSKYLPQEQGLWYTFLVHKSLINSENIALENYKKSITEGATSWVELTCTGMMKLFFMFYYGETAKVIFAYYCRTQLTISSVVWLNNRGNWKRRLTVLRLDVYSGHREPSRLVQWPIPAS